MRNILKAVAQRLTRQTKTLVIWIYRSRFMARTSYEEGARHDFVPQNVMRKRARGNTSTLFNMAKGLSTIKLLSLAVLLSLASFHCTSNRRLIVMVRPHSADTLTMLTLGGISHDYVYIIPGHWRTLDVPKDNFLHVRDPFAILADSTWKLVQCPIDSIMVENTLVNPRWLSILSVNNWDRDSIRKSPSLVYSYNF